MKSIGRISSLSSSASGTCTVIGVQAHQLTVQSTAAFALASVVKVEVGNCLWMGPVCACEPAPEGYTVELEIESTLNDVASVEELAARFRHERTTKRKQIA